MTEASPMSGTGHSAVGSLRRLRLAGWLEALTLLFLIAIAVPLKYLAGWPVAVKLAGPIHGLVFVFYWFTLIESISAGGWVRNDIVRAAIACIIPFGPLLNDISLRKRIASAGPIGGSSSS